MEDALKKDIGDERFIPYIQLHEFEALLLSDPGQLQSQFDGSADGIERLATAVARFPSPEHVNDGATTAPSKRIIREIPEYEGRKTSAGPIAAAKIGLPTLRAKCAHFAEWLTKLETLATENYPVPTDTSEQGLKERICTALTSHPANPAAPTPSPNARRNACVAALRPKFFCPISRKLSWNARTSLIRAHVRVQPIHPPQARLQAPSWPTPPPDPQSSCRVPAHRA